MSMFAVLWFVCRARLGESEYLIVGHRLRSNVLRSIDPPTHPLRSLHALGPHVVSRYWHFLTLLKYPWYYNPENGRTYRWKQFVLERYEFVFLWQVRTTLLYFLMFRRYITLRSLLFWFHGTECITVSEVVHASDVRRCRGRVALGWSFLSIPLRFQEDLCAISERSSQPSDDCMPPWVLLGALTRMNKPYKASD